MVKKYCVYAHFGVGEYSPLVFCKPYDGIIERNQTAKDIKKLIPGVYIKKFTIDVEK